MALKHHQIQSATNWEAELKNRELRGSSNPEIRGSGSFQSDTNSERRERVLNIQPVGPDACANTEWSRAGKLQLTKLSIHLLTRETHINVVLILLELQKFSGLKSASCNLPARSHGGTDSCMKFLFKGWKSAHFDPGGGSGLSGDVRSSFFRFRWRLQFGFM